MIEQELRDKLGPAVQTNRIIVLAMAGGLFVTAAVMVAVRASGDFGPPPETPLVSLIAGGVAGMALISRPFVALMGTISDDGRLEAWGTPLNEGVTGDPLVDRVTRNWTVETVVRGAVLEGPALLNAIAYVLEGQWWSLLITAALLAWLLAGLPTMHQLEQRIEERRAGVTPEPDL